MKCPRDGKHEWEHGEAQEPHICPEKRVNDGPPMRFEECACCAACVKSCEAALADEPPITAWDRREAKKAGR